MIVLGLTGSLGMGKTMAAGMLRTMKIPVHDSDAAVHRLLAPGGAGVAAVAAAFPQTLDPSRHGIDRAALRAALMNADDWRRLEAILHPLVRVSQEKFLRQARLQHWPVAVLDIPLLFETGAQARVDYTLCVTAPAFLQWQRARRRGMTRADFDTRLARQMPDAEKRALADFVVQTGNGRAYTYKKLRRILNGLRTGLE